MGEVLVTASSANALSLCSTAPPSFSTPKESEELVSISEDANDKGDAEFDSVEESKVPVASYDLNL